MSEADLPKLDFGHGLDVGLSRTNARGFF